jgi:hypothetical protein
MLTILFPTQPRLSHQATLHSRLITPQNKLQLTFHFLITVGESKFEVMRNQQGNALPCLRTVAQYLRHTKSRSVSYEGGEHLIGMPPVAKLVPDGAEVMGA